MTLKQLEAFYWAANCKSFAVAANRLNISVSSLSKRIAELETSIGSELFSRNARSATLTPLGEQLIPHAKDLLRNADQFMKRASNSRALSGRCRFGVGELTSLTWMPRLIEEIQRTHPKLSIEPFVGVGELIECRLVEGELDFAIIAGPSTRPFITSSLIGHTEFIWVASKKAVPNPTTLPPQALADHTLIILPQSAGTVRMLDDWMAELNVSPGRNLNCNSWGAIAGLIRQGLGLGFLPSAWAQIMIERGDVHLLSAFPVLRPLQYTIQWRRDDTRPLLQHMRELALRTIDFHAPSCLL